jgi:hypothetical protein
MTGGAANGCPDSGGIIQPTTGSRLEVFPRADLSANYTNVRVAFAGHLPTIASMPSAARVTHGKTHMAATKEKADRSWLRSSNRRIARQATE